MAEVSVLIVEDDDTVARVEDWRLKKLGYNVCGRAINSADAIRLAARHNPDIVLMDINLQGEVDGIETAQQIKREFNIPVVFVTSHSDDATLVRVKATRPEGFIIKPFEDEDLRVAIELAVVRE